MLEPTSHCDDLRRLSADIAELAIANGFDCYVAETLKLRARNSARVLLELGLSTSGEANQSDSYVILRHRHPGWTETFKNRSVTRNWVERFIRYNSELALLLSGRNATTATELISNAPNETPLQDEEQRQLRISKTREREAKAIQRELETKLIEENRLRNNEQIIEANLRLGLGDSEWRSEQVSYSEYLMYHGIAGNYEQRGALIYPLGRGT